MPPSRRVPGSQSLSSTRLLRHYPRAERISCTKGLHALDRDLQTRGSYLVIRPGKPRDVLRQLLQETSADAIFAEEDFTPYARKRDAQVAGQLAAATDPRADRSSSRIRPKKRWHAVHGFHTLFQSLEITVVPEIHLLPAPEKISTRLSDIPGETSAQLRESIRSSLPGKQKPCAGLERNSFSAESTNIPIRRNPQPHGLGRHFLPLAVSALWNARA